MSVLAVFLLGLLSAHTALQACSGGDEAEVVKEIEGKRVAALEEKLRKLKGESAAATIRCACARRAAGSIR